MHNVPFGARPRVRIGFIGLGSRGRFLMSILLKIEGVEVSALYDADENAVQKALPYFAEQDQARPRTFAGTEGWARLLEQDLDLVYVTCPWEQHAFYAVRVMEAGKHVAVEVPAAVTLEECWELVETSERTRRHCVMLENCCYSYWEMLARRMAEGGMFGTLTHAECAYIHDLRALMVSDESRFHWRLAHHVTRDGNLYPTHGLGPVAQTLGIGTTDAFDYMVSMSSREASLTEYCETNLAETDERRTATFRCGDMNTSLIRTKLGRTIVLQHDVVTPRPYSRGFLIAGTKGMFQDYPPRLFLDGAGEHDQWLSLDAYKAEWEHPLWKSEGDAARAAGGHGGMDYLMQLRLIQAMRDGTPPDMDVYDAALWSVPSALSEQSVRSGSSPVKFPDFQRK